MNTESPGAWAIILLLCTFMLMINLTLVSLWRHRHQPPPRRKPELNFPFQQVELRRNEEADWERLSQAVRQLPSSQLPQESVDNGE